MKVLKMIASIPIWIIKMIFKMVCSMVKSLYVITKEIIDKGIFLIWLAITTLLTYAFGGLLVVEALIGFGWGSIMLLAYIFKYEHLSEATKMEIYLPIICIIAMPITIYMSRFLLFVLDIYTGLIPWTIYYIKVGFNKARKRLINRNSLDVISEELEHDC